MKFFTSLHQFDIRYSIFCCSLLSIFCYSSMSQLCQSSAVYQSSAFLYADNLHSSMFSLIVPQVYSDYFLIFLNVLGQVFSNLLSKAQHHDFI